MNRYRLIYTLLLTALMASMNASAGVTVKGSVYGGGNLASVGGNATVNVGGGEIGTENKGGALYGNVYGGGKGDVTGDDKKDVELGLVKGNTIINIFNGTILHNVYGGGAYGSVGTYTYDTSGNITEYNSGGKATITITGGTIGTTGQENGMVFGSSRGDVGATGEIHDKLAWVHDTHVIIGTTGQGTDAPQPQIKGSVYGSGENGHTYENTVIDIHSGTIGITDTSIDGGAAYAYRGNVYGGGCGTDTYALDYRYDSNKDGVIDDNDDYAKAYNPLAGIVQGTTTVNIDGGRVVHNVYGAGAMGSVGKTNADGAIESGGTTTIKISGGTVGVSGTVGDGNVFGAARGDAASTQTDVALVKTTDVTISQAEGKTTKIYGNVYGGGECGDVGTYTTDANDANIYPTGSGVCNVTITGGTIGDNGNGHGNVFGAGKGDAGTFKCMKAMVYKANVAVSNGTVYGNIYGGGEIGRVENDTKVEIGTVGEIVNTSKPDIKGNVFGAGKGFDTHGYSALVRGNPVVNVQGSAKVGGNVYGGGQIASVGKHSLVTVANKDDHPELEVGMPFTLANTEVGVCTVTVKDKAEITGNVFGAGKGIKPAEITNPGRMTPSNTMETYDPSSNAFHIYVQTLALVTETHVTIGGDDTGTATKVKGSVYGGSESGFVQYHTHVDIQKNCEIGTSSVEGNVYGGGLGISGNDVAGRVGGDTYLDINGGTTHGSVFGGGAYGIVKGGVEVNINDGTIDEDVYGGGALAHTNTAMWDDTHSQLLEYAEVKNLIVGSSSVKGYYTELGGNYTLIEDQEAKAESGTLYYAIYKTNVNLIGGQLRDAYGGGLGQLAREADTEHNVTALADVPAYVYGDVQVKLNEGKTGDDKGCIVNRIFGCNNQNGTPKGKVQVYVHATQNKNKAKIGTDKTAANYHPAMEAEDAETTYDVAAVYGGGNLSPYEPEDAKLAYNETNKAKVDAARSEVYIYGCDLTSIKQVYGGGNAAPAPATFVQVNSVYEIEELFGGGNGYNDYKLYGKWYVNPGANVGYKNYTHLDGTGDGSEGSPFGCAENSDATNKADRQNPAHGYMYGSGIATIEVFGGKIHAAYGGSNQKGNISNTISSTYEESGDCTLKVDATYGGGKNSVIDGVIKLDVGCADDMPQIFGGSKAADVNSDITLRITNGKYGQVFGGNNTSGNVNGSITVIIKESGCKPINIDELYAGGYFANYSVYGYYKDTNDQWQPRTKAQYDALDDEAKAAITVRKDPRVLVISASHIGDIYGGGYKATVVGNPHVNINMERGFVVKKYAEKMSGYSEADKDDDLNMLLPIGTINNVYGGGNEADIEGSTYVEIGTGTWHNDEGKLETEDAAGHKYTYEEKTTGEWKWYNSNGVAQETVPIPVRRTAKITGNVFGGGNMADVKVNTNVTIDGDDSSVSATNQKVIIGGNVYGGGNLGDVGTIDKSDNVNYNYTWTGNNPAIPATSETSATPAVISSGLCTVHIAGGIIGLTGENETQDKNHGNVFGAGKGEEAPTFWCEKGMVYKSVVNIDNGTVKRNVYGGGEVGRVEYDTEVTIGLASGSSTPKINGDVFGAGAGIVTHGYSALVRGDAYVTVQGNAEIGQGVYGGGELATVGKYNIAKTSDEATLHHVKIGMPYETVSGGMCTVEVLGSAKVGPDASGHIFGGGKGVDPTNDGYTYKNTTDEEKRSTRPKRMTLKPSTLPTIYDATANDRVIWEYFDGKDDYYDFLQTLALAHDTHVTIKGSAEVKGSVYGGSESGFVQNDTDVKIQGTSKILKTGTDANGKAIDGNVFGGGKGVEVFSEAGRVRGNTTVAISGGTTQGSVYGGGELGDVGRINKEDPKKNYKWANELGILEDNYTYNNTGLCNVSITNAAAKVQGNVFGAGKGLDDTFWCEKAMAYKTIVTISAGTVEKNVYGGGEIGRVELDTQVKIGDDAGSNKPIINGSVFGAGAGVVTHGYSALVRNNTTVTIQAQSQIGKSVYGGGEIASVGKYGLDAKEMPSILKGGGVCTVTIKDKATVGVKGGGDVFGAGQGIDKPFVSGESQRMTVINGVSDTEYFTSPESYKTFLETLGLATAPTVNIEGSASVNGSVYGGGEVGITKGAVVVNIKGGTIEKDVYGGGALANTNTGNWSPNKNFVKATVESGASVTGLYKRTGTGTDEDPYVYTVITSTTEVAVNGTDYYTTEGAWTDNTGTAWKTTTVNLLGGTIKGDVYGGGLGRLAKAASGESAEVKEVKAMVYGDILVEQKGTKFVWAKIKDDMNHDIVGSGRIFGCNNLNGSPLGEVKVHVYKTIPQSGDTHTLGKYDMAAVYGGGNLAAYEPMKAVKTNSDEVKEKAFAEVIIDGCADTSIEQVYGGGNAASTPGTKVTVNGTFEIGEVFGGGNGKDRIRKNNVWMANPGANVGFTEYADNDEHAQTKADRKTYFEYGSGIARVNIYGGKIHAVYGGSNTKGNVRETAVAMLDGQTNTSCAFDVEEAYGGGKSADMDGIARLELICISGLAAVYGGSENADVNGDVELNITNGKFTQVFGGNNVGGRINGSITVNIEETGCNPIILGELYGGGNRAAYSVYGYKPQTKANGSIDYDDYGKIRWLPLTKGESVTIEGVEYKALKDQKGEGDSDSDVKHKNPQVNVKSFSSIGTIFGGGYGSTAIMVADPYVYIDVVKSEVGHDALIKETDNRTMTIIDEAEDGTTTSRVIEYPTHEQGKIGAIQNVFGGGNQAEVIGTPHVYIGTQDKIDFVTKSSSAESPRKNVTVEGVDIRGNVYGGGNNATVTGDTDVQIGRKIE